MSKGKDAEVVVGADVSAAKRAAAELKTAWKGAGEGMQAAIGGAANAIISDLAHVATSAGKVSFSSQHQQVKDLEAATARMSASSGQSLAQLRAETEATGIAIGKRPKEVNEWATSVGQLTHNFEGASKQIEGFAGLAARTGKHVNDYRGLAVELATIGKVAGDSSHVLGVLETQAEKFGVVGGISAFATQVEGLSDTISHFSIKSEADFLKVTAAAAALGKGLNQQAAGRVQQSVFGLVQGRTLDLERYLGRKLTNEQGQIEDPAAIMQEYVAKTTKRHGRERAQRNLAFQIGPEAAAAAFNADWKAVDKAGALPASDKQKAALEKYKGSDAGKRDVAEAELAKASRDLMGSSTALGKAADALQKFSASNPIAGTAGAVVAGGAATAVGGAVVKAVVGNKAGGGILGGSKILGNVVKYGSGILAAGAAGYGIGTGLDYVTSYSDRITGTNNDKHILKRFSVQTIKQKSDQDDVAADAKLQDRVKAIRAQNASNAEARAAAQPLSGGGDLLKQMAASFQQINKAGGMDDASADKIAKAMVSALQGGMKVEVTNATETPIQATVKGSKSSQAGRQGRS